MTQYPHPYPGFAPTRPAPRNGMGTAALVLGICGVVVAVIPIVGFFGFISGIIGAILGPIGVSRANKGEATNRGVALAGTILSIAALVVSTIVFFSFASAVSSASSVRPAAPDISSLPTASAPAYTQETPAYEPQTQFQVGQAAELDGLRINPGDLQPRKGTLGARLLCSMVTMSNNSSENKDFNGLFEWKIQDPSNVQQTLTPFAANILTNGTLAPGGKVAGNVCIEDQGQRGAYALIYQEAPFGTTTITWSTTH